ncbi:hypothetical protein Tco_1228066 [Tanacetum coccineum]
MKQPRRKQRKDTEVPQPSGSTEPITDEAANEEHVPIHYNDPLLSGEDRLKLNELIELCTNLSQRVLDLENTKTSQAAEITKLKERVNKRERRNKSRTPGVKRLRKVGRSAQVVSSEDEDSFVSMDSKVVKGEQERIKNQKIDADQEEAKMKNHIEIVVDEEEIVVDAIPLATKPPIIVDWKIIKEGKIRYFQIIRADGSSRRYSSMINMLRNIDREDLETL